MNNLNEISMQFCKNYHEFLNKIDSFNSNSENLFLKYSSVFEEAHAYIKTQAMKSTELNNLLNSVEMSSNLGAVDSLIQSLQSFFKKSQSDFDNMSSLYYDLQATSYKFNKYKKMFVKVIKLLRMHVVSIKIKSSMLDKDKKDFLVIASRILELIHHVEKNLFDIEEQITTLQVMISKSTNRIEQIKDSRKLHWEMIKSISDAELNMLKVQKNSIQGSIKEIDDMYKDINKYMFQVIMSIQAQDILRQEFSRIQKVFNDLSTTVDSIENSNGSISEEQKQSLIIFTNHIDKEIKKLHEIRDYVFKSTMTLEDAPNALIQLLQELVQRLTVYLHDVFEGNSIENLGKEFKEIKKPFEEENSIIENEKMIVKDIVKKCDNMYTYIDDINNIENDIKIISINAQIKANEVENFGKPLEVLSASIRNISHETNEISFNINNIITNITESSKGLEEEMDDEKLQSKRNRIDNLQSNIGRFFNNLSTIESDVSIKLKDILADTDKNMNFIQDKFENLSIMDFINENFDEILDFMKSYRNQTIEIFHLEIDDKNKNVLSDKIGEYYEVALDELNTDHAELDDVDFEDDDDIELF